MNILKYIAVVLFALVLFSCKNEVTQNTQICVLIDVTDEKFKDDNFVEENLPKFLKLMKLDTESGGFSGGEIKLSLINEVSDSKSKTIKIAEAETGMMGENPLNRKDEVNRFNNQLRQSFTTILEEANWGTSASKIYQKVTRELIKMSKKDYDRNYLVIYSDMLENSNLFSFYGQNWKSEIEALIAEPEKAIEKLSDKGPAMPDLSNFEIYVVVSRNPENDEKINLSEQFWTSLFEYQGATVSFNSTLEL